MAEQSINEFLSRQGKKNEKLLLKTPIKLQFNKLEKNLKY
jgi:hypothetical protein